MFEVRILCEDNKLQKVMWALDGIVVGMPQVIPVRGAKASPDKKKVVATTTDTITNRFSDCVLSLSDEELTTQRLVEIAVSVGSANPTAGRQMIHKLVNLKILKKVGQGRYKVIRN